MLAFKKGYMVFNQPGSLPPEALEDLIGRIRDLDIDKAIAENEAANQS